MIHAESGDGKTKSDDGILSDYSLLVLSHKNGTLESVLFATQEKRKKVYGCVINLHNHAKLSWCTNATIKSLGT